MESRRTVAALRLDPMVCIMQSSHGDLARLLHDIQQPIVCSRCADDVTYGRVGEVSMAEYMRLDVGYSSVGIQVWCRRHDANVVHIDFEGQDPPADFRCIQKRS